MSMSRFLASAAVGGLAVLLASAPGRAQSAAPPYPLRAGSSAAGADGSLAGAVRNEDGAAVAGVLVSAFGASRAFTVTDESGRFEFHGLPPGAYLVRAHRAGYGTSPGQLIDVGRGATASALISLRRTPAQGGSSDASAAPILAAGVGLVADGPDGQGARAASPDASDRSSDRARENRSETAWRLRHLRRSVLQEADGTILLAEAAEESNGGGPIAAVGRSVSTSARAAASLFGASSLSGELNLLTTSSFDSPQQLFSSDTPAQSVAYVSVRAPAGSGADWTIRGALSQADLSSWVVAGTYATRGPLRHQYDIGLSYATERYDGGNPAALRDLADGSRNAGAIYGFDTFAVSRSVKVTYGARYARYDYLDDKALVSPRAAVTVAATDHLRLRAAAAHRSIAPGAEEFLPPGDTGVWLPPQRTFSSISPDLPLHAEVTTAYSVEADQDVAEALSVSIGAFRQLVADQLLTIFGMDIPGLPSAKVGHYFVGTLGDADARGLTAAVSAHLSDRVHGSIEYSLTDARWLDGGSAATLARLPSASRLRASRIQGLATAIAAEVPETSTHVTVFYRVMAPSAAPGADDRSFDGRFDIQLRQSLPFMNFSAAKWEMLVAVRNLFRDAGTEGSVFDELLVIHPPKRLVGGLTMRF